MEHGCCGSPLRPTWATCHTEQGGRVHIWKNFQTQGPETLLYHGRSLESSPDTIEGRKERRSVSAPREVLSRLYTHPLTSSHLHHSRAATSMLSYLWASAPDRSQDPSLGQLPIEAGQPCPNLPVHGVQICGLFRAAEEPISLLPSSHAILEHPSLSSSFPPSPHPHCHPPAPTAPTSMSHVQLMLGG